MESAKKEIAKLTPANEQEKAILTKAKSCLDEGIKAIEVCQKHIKIADRSELGWAVVAAAAFKKEMSSIIGHGQEESGRQLDD